MADVEIFSGEMGTGVLVHGGAGDVERSRRAEHIEGCEEAARRGYEVLAGGGSALDAVQAAARVLEDLPQFNAGTGAALNVDGEVEHDAALMDGATLEAGSVAALRGFKNPIDVARALLDDGRHVMVVADGAAAFARSAGIAPVDPASLITERARAALERVLSGKGPKSWAGGTIGAVARDARGSVAAATSTGGTIAKLRGRVGDSPIIGAGTIADDASCALSATGDGEGILRIGVARLVASLVESGAELAPSCARVLEQTLTKTAARGGVIVVRPSGQLVVARTTNTMSWAAHGETFRRAGI